MVAAGARSTKMKECALEEEEEQRAICEWNARRRSSHCGAASDVYGGSVVDTATILSPKPAAEA